MGTMTPDVHQAPRGRAGIFLSSTTQGYRACVPPSSRHGSALPSGESATSSRNTYRYRSSSVGQPEQNRGQPARRTRSARTTALLRRSARSPPQGARRAIPRLSRETSTSHTCPAPPRADQRISLHHGCARPHHEDAVGYALHVRDDVGGEQHDLVLGEPRDKVAESHALLEVRPAHRLVEHEHRRIVEHRLRDAEPLLHAARERPDAAALLAGEPHGGEQLEGALARGAAGDALERGHVLHEVERRELGVVAKSCGRYRTDSLRPSARWAPRRSAPRPRWGATRRTPCA